MFVIFGKIIIGIMNKIPSKKLNTKGINSAGNIFAENNRSSWNNLSIFSVGPSQ